MKNQGLVQFNSRCILQFISGISNDLKKLDKCFNGTITFAPFSTPAALKSSKKT